MEAKRVTTQRKRSACGQLRSLALELGVENANAHLDMTIRQFESFATDLEQHCATPEQRAKLQTAVAEFHARPAPPLPGSGGADANVQSAGPAPPAQNAGSAGSGPSSQQGFRLRSQGCLFTYNSINFGEVIWGDFVAWLATLECSARWSATMEKSLKSEERGRVHLHVFMEFTKSVDWTSLRPVVFMAVTPDASPCVARGPRFRQALDHGHFYVYANKIGTVRVATSGYVPWEDYAVKGWWLDNLWTEHKLAHDVYLEYACLECSRQCVF